MTTNVQNVTAEVQALCADLRIDEAALQRICRSVQESVARVGSLNPDETIVFCDCDAQFTGNCRLPFLVDEDNPCNADTADKPLKRNPHNNGYFFPVGALTGTDGMREPGTPLKLCGQRVEISAMRSDSAVSGIPATAVPEISEIDTWPVQVQV